MTRTEAIHIREKQLCGHAVAPLLVIDAIEVLKQALPKNKGGRPATGTSKSALKRAKAKAVRFTRGEVVL